MIQAVVLYELQMESPNDYRDFPLVDRDVIYPDITLGNDPQSEQEYNYWNHVEFIIQRAIQ